MHKLITSCFKSHPRRQGNEHDYYYQTLLAILGIQLNPMQDRKFARSDYFLARFYLEVLQDPICGGKLHIFISDVHLMYAIFVFQLIKRVTSQKLFYIYMIDIIAVIYS